MWFDLTEPPALGAHICRGGGHGCTGVVRDRASYLACRCPLRLLGFLSGRWLTLVFHPLEIISVGVAAFIFSFVRVDGETNWLEGIQLLSLYLMLAVVFFFLPLHP